MEDLHVKSYPYWSKKRKIEKLNANQKGHSVIFNIYMESMNKDTKNKTHLERAKKFSLQKPEDLIFMT